METNVLHRWQDILALKKGQKVYPHFVDFHTSDACNHNCIGCAYRGRLTGKLMPESDHFQAVDLFLRLGVKAFDFAGGGEPTLLPYLPKLMKHIAQSKAHFGLITNGSNLTDDLVYALLEHGTYLRVSLEAANPKEFEKYKGVPKDNFKKIIKNVSRIVIERNKRHSQLEVSLKFSVSKTLSGPGRYRTMFALAEVIGADRISIKCLRHDPEELTKQERYKEYLAYFREKPIFPKVKIVESILPKTYIPQCWLSPLHTVMDQDGNVYICCYYYYRKEEFLIGNIFQRPFEEFWMKEDHLRKIKNIRQSDCAKVDCKFFAHHKAVYEAEKRGAIYFL